MTPRRTPTPKPFASPNRKRVAQFRHGYALEGMAGLAPRIARLTGNQAAAALLLTIATEDWTEDEKRAMHPSVYRRTLKADDQELEAATA